MPTDAPPDESVVLIDGPWSHHFVSANGRRFHVVEAGNGPLVLLLHGYPEFWWTWRHQLPALADAGYRAVACDLRGYGASDKPPRGYDGYTMASDIAGMIRALGERDATLVGHDLGGLLAWVAATFHPRWVRQLIVLSAPHPLQLRSALMLDPRGQLAASRHMLKFQLPRYEHVMTRNNAQAVGRLLASWAGPTWRQTDDFQQYAQVCRTAMRIPQASFCALEAYRWAARSMLRLSGYRFNKLLQTPIMVPTLQLHGSLDPCFLPRTAQGSGRYVASRYEWLALDGIGHFPQLEAPEVVNGEIVRWLKES